jgi:hypothetical protein
VRFQDSFGTILKVSTRGESCLLHVLWLWPHAATFCGTLLTHTVAQAHMDNLKRREKVKPARAGKKPG